eukprot:Awhi_evm1s13172
MNTSTTIFSLFLVFFLALSIQVQAKCKVTIKNNKNDGKTIYGKFYNGGDNSMSFEKTRRRKIGYGSSKTGWCLGNGNGYCHVVVYFNGYTWTYDNGLTSNLMCPLDNKNSMQYYGVQCGGTLTVGSDYNCANVSGYQGIGQAH